MSFTDVYGKKRKAGDQWLIGISETDTHIIDVHEELVQEVQVITLTNREYCYIKNPLKDGQTQFGVRILVRGEK